MEPWHSRKVEEVYKALYTQDTGISDQNAKERLTKYGYNELEEKNKKTPLQIFLSQFKSVIMWVLIIATVVSYAIGFIDPAHAGESKVDAIVILIILILNAVFGFIQEYKAEKSIEALKRLAALKAKVIRNGKEKKIDSRELVPGDIILLETGDKVPADARIIELSQLNIDESSLTGESTSVRKEVKPVGEFVSLAERTCMLYSSTIVSKGKAKAVVTGTGMGTEIGKIANMVQSADEKQSPLQEKLAQLGSFLAIATLIVCAVVFVVLLLRSGSVNTQTITNAFMVAVSLAVAAIPEGLPAVVTICLALGVQRMVKKNALVRVLPSVETLGSCNIICTDKTGTLTYNQMTVRRVFVYGKDITVSGHGYVPEGKFEMNGKAFNPRQIDALLKIGALCNDSKLQKTGDKWEIFGDPTEAALIVAARKAGIDESKLEPRVDEIPFDSTRKLMTTVHKQGKKKMAYVKGAPDIIIEHCDRILVNGKVRKLTKKDKQEVLDKNLEMANKALRVLGFAYKEVKGKLNEEKLVFVGLMGMIDPPRQEVRDSIAKCKEAGIRVVMITGDHKATAVAIGNELGLPDGKVLTGEELDTIKDISRTIEEVTVYARVSPQHKMRIVNALKDKKYVVAMTGDGVNDAPALKRADIGVAMGISGTDVAKEASDMILTDDNFASIVNAVEEGRGIYDNIRKFVKYLLSSNFGEILVIFVAILIGYHYPDNPAKVLLPLVPIQLLWMNLLTDGLPALALGVEPTDPDVMAQKPRKSSDKIISGRYGVNMAFLGIVMALGTLFVFHHSLATGDVVYASTMAFTTLVIFQLFNVLNCKSQEKSIFLTGIFNNKWLLIAIASSLGLQFLVLYTPLSAFMNTTAISLMDWLTICLVGSTVIIFEEVRKFVRRMARGRA